MKGGNGVIAVELKQRDNRSNTEQSMLAWGGGAEAEHARGASLLFAGCHQPTKSAEKSVIVGVKCSRNVQQWGAQGSGGQ